MERQAPRQAPHQLSLNAWLPWSRLQGSCRIHGGTSPHRGLWPCLCPIGWWTATFPVFSLPVPISEELLLFGWDRPTPQREVHSSHTLTDSLVPFQQKWRLLSVSWGVYGMEAEPVSVGSLLFVCFNLITFLRERACTGEHGQGMGQRERERT